MKTLPERRQWRIQRGKSGHGPYPVWLQTLAPSNEEVYVRYWETYWIGPPNWTSGSAPWCGSP